MLAPEPGDCQSEAELARLKEELARLEEDRRLSQAVTQLSEDALRKVWDNPEDAEYDRLIGSVTSFLFYLCLRPPLLPVRGVGGGGRRGPG